MKKIALLLSFVTLFWGCQKKEYATFTYSQSAYLHQLVAEAPATAPVVPAVQLLSASAREDLSALTEKETPLSTIPFEAIYSKAEQATGVAAEVSGRVMVLPNFLLF